jgi:hypothetical protein
MNCAGELLNEQSDAHREGRVYPDRMSELVPPSIFSQRVLGAEPKQPRDYAAHDGGDDLPKERVSGLGERRLDGAVDEHRSGAHRGDDQRRAVPLDDGRVGHDSLDEDDADECAERGEDERLVFERNSLEQRKWEYPERFIRRFLLCTKISANMNPKLVM